MNYGKAIRICRTAHGMTQQELAGQTSVGASQLSLVESGRRQPSVRVLQEVTAALNVPMHLFTLLASDEQDLRKESTQAQINEFAKALLDLLVCAGKQRTLPLMR